MAYVAPDIKDQSVQYPNRFKIDGVSHTIEPDFGTVTEPGTPVNRDLLQPMADAIENTYEIGDIKTTLLEQDDKWLLCDGSIPDYTAYPALTDVLTDATPLGTWPQQNQGSAHLNGVAYGNGYWVAVGASGTIYYKKDHPNGTWTQNSHGSLAFYSVAYGNGYWVAVGVSGTLYYKQGDPDGDWTQNNQGTTTLLGVTFGNNYFAAVGYSGILYYKANDPTSSWTLNTQGSATRWSIAYGNGYWAAVGDSGEFIFKPTSAPNGTWTSFTQGSASRRSIVYGNGYWVMEGLYTATNPNTGWTANSSLRTHNAYVNGYWITAGSSGDLRYKAATPDGTFTANNQGSSAFNGVAGGERGLVLIGQSGLMRHKLPQLPTISIGAHAYIRGK